MFVESSSPISMQFVIPRFHTWWVIYLFKSVCDANGLHARFTWRGNPKTELTQKSLCGWVWSFFVFPCSELSFAVPVANALSFLCTLLTGKLLGEEFGGKSK